MLIPQIWHWYPFGTNEVVFVCVCVCLISCCSTSLLIPILHGLCRTEGCRSTLLPAHLSPCLCHLSSHPASVERFLPTEQLRRNIFYKVQVNLWELLFASISLLKILASCLLASAEYLFLSFFKKRRDLQSSVGVTVQKWFGQMFQDWSLSINRGILNHTLDTCFWDHFWSNLLLDLLRKGNQQFLDFEHPTFSSNGNICGWQLKWHCEPLLMGDTLYSSQSSLSAPPSNKRPDPLGSNCFFLGLWTAGPFRQRATPSDTHFLSSCICFRYSSARTLDLWHSFWAKVRTGRTPKIWHSPLHACGL